jgi:S1-C subfamily serine protease
MLHSSRNHHRISLILCLLFTASISAGETLKIISNPAGATVELDGVPAGSTPFEKELPGGYFHRTRTVLGQRLEHPMVARISLAGFATREIALTEGPMDWIDLHGRHHGQYWLLKSDHFLAELDPISSTFTGTVNAPDAVKPAANVQPELSLEEIVRISKPAVVYLKTLDKAGSGFFVTDTGVLATNAHLARGESSLLALLPSGLQLDAKVVFVDPDLDIALLKVPQPSATYAFPHLALAEASSVRQGESVLAIGNPGDAMLFSVTKGIVSAVGKFVSAGPGTWIQTDAPINPGNSGGPLVNLRGEVIGLNTQKLIKKNTNGIGFALSASDLLSVLHRFYPASAATIVTAAETAPEPAAAVTSAASAEPSSATSPAVLSSAAPIDGFGVLNLSSEPEAAEIYIDGKFFGNTPASLKLAAGTHAVTLKFSGFPDYVREIEIPKSSRLTLKGLLKIANQL